ncbi:MAG: hypothetical protein R2809_04890 [Flavobacteriales bacterium]
MGIIYAGALYFRDRFNKNYGSQLAALLGFLRFAAVFMISFFLLKPLVKTTNNTEEKPIIVLAQDNSNSIIVGGDSSYYKNDYLIQIKALKEKLSEKFDVQTFSFGDEVKSGIDSIQFDEELTDFTALYDAINSKYSGRNLGAVVIASDGIFNKGSNPLYAFNSLKAPVYTIALGDTTIKKDALIAEVNANRLAYLNNRFPISIRAEGRKAKGEKAIVEVSHKGNVVFNQEITFDSNRASKTIDIIQEASSVGLQKYTVTISRLENEITYVNNKKDIYIDVLDSRQKVLILAANAHPDINALHESISNNEAYQVNTFLINKFSGNVEDYNLVIFHQLPAAGQLGANQILSKPSKNIPELIYMGWKH